MSRERIRTLYVRGGVAVLIGFFLVAFGGLAALGAGMALSSVSNAVQAAALIVMLLGITLMVVGGISAGIAYVNAYSQAMRDYGTWRISSIELNHYIMEEEGPRHGRRR